MIMYLLLGVVFGCIGASIVWAIVYAGRMRSMSRTEEKRDAIVSAIGKLCGSVENAVGAYQMGAMDANSFRSQATGILEEITDKLQTNMHQVDPYFVKYVESLVANARDAAAKAGAAAAVDEAPEMDLFDAAPRPDVQQAPAAVAPAVFDEPAVKADEEEIAAPAQSYVNEPTNGKVEAEEAGEAGAEESPAPAAQEIIEEDAPFSMDAAETIIADRQTVITRKESESETETPSEEEGADSVEQERAAEGQAGMVQQTPAAAEHEEEAFYASANKYVPIEESGLLSGDQDQSEQPRQEEASIEVQEEQPEAPSAGDEQQDKSDRLQAQETMELSQEHEPRDEFDFDVQQTQIYTKDAFSKIVHADDESQENEAPAMNAEEDEDSRIGADFIFGDNQKDSVPEQVEEGEDYFDIGDSKASHYENAIDQEEKPQDKSGDDDDSLITGDDVIKKMDDFFNFS